MPRSGFARHTLICLMLLLPALQGVTAAQGNPAGFDRLAAQAAAARDAGRADDALRLYRQTLDVRPDWDEGWWFVGTISYDSDRYADAIPAFQKLVKLNAQLAPAWALLGLSEFETKAYTAAAADLGRALQLGLSDNPDIDKVAKYHSSLLFLLSGEFEKATGSLLAQTAGGAVPEQIKIALGLALLRVPILPGQLDPSRDALVRSAGEASVLTRAGAAAASPAFEQLLKDYPDTPYLHYAYGTALAADARYEEALAQFMLETQQTPKSPLAYERAAEMQLELQRPKEALDTARQAVRLGPQSSFAHKVLAQALDAAGEHEPAARESHLAQSQAGTAMAPDSAIAQRYQRGTSPAPALQSSPAPSASSTDAAASQGDFQQLSRDAAAAKQAGHQEDAIHAYQAALKLRPDWEPGWADLGTLFYTASRYAEAIPCLKNSVELNPGRSEAWALLGLSEYEIRDYQNALIHLQHSLGIGVAGNAAAVSYAKLHIAMLLNRKGEFDRATSTLVPEVTPGPFLDKIKFTLGVSLLRLPLLPEDVNAAQSGMVREAGEAAALLSQSHYDDAFQVFEQMLKRYPNTPYVQYVYGDALASISRFDEAKAHLLEETKITPNSALPYVRLASISLQLHNPAEGLPSAERGVQLAPQSAEAHYALGRSLLEIGKADAAAKELETASTLAPNRPEIHFNLAKAYAKAGESEKAEKERTVFAQLNALVEQQKSKRGNQSYGASRDRGAVSPSDLPAEPEAKPE